MFEAPASLEPKILYRAPREEVPEGDYVVEIGKARVAREGDDVTLVTYGAWYIKRWRRLRG
ncbi:hypothetical protein [Pyrobaculum aerophilum]|uniref:hypothetical protein n=1 Tax=Pyrobaculum aerophilum TaxID=13773 RepID=UPI00216314C5|nr:hypothetical protein [Pyrobaculum aerophilum]